MLKHISGFDYLRAFFSILVVVWHAKGISFIAKFNEDLLYIVDIFYYNVCLLAVPVFFSISLFFIYKKQLIGKNYYFRKRLSNLLVIYCIWMVIGIATESLISKGEYIWMLFNLKNLLFVLVTGSRPELYFLFSLIVISCLAGLNSKYLLNRKNSLWIQLILLFFSLLLLVIASFSTLMTHLTIFSAYWNPICFIPYIFSSSILAIVHEYTDSMLTRSLRKKILFLTLILIFLLISWWEWQVFKQPQIFGYLLPPYARVSLVIGAFIVCYHASLYKGKTPIWIQILSQESLGIYLLHGYALLIIGLLIGRVQDFQLLLKIIFNPINNVILSVAISVLLSKVLKQYKIGRAILNSSTKESPRFG